MPKRPKSEELRAGLGYLGDGQHFNHWLQCTGWVKKSKLLILSECVNNTEKIGWTWTNMNSCRENEALSDISRVIFYVTIVLCLNIQWLKEVNEITARQTRTSFAKFSQNYSIEYLTTKVELVLPTFKSWTVHKIRQYLTLGLLFSFEISSTVQQLTFLTHPVYRTWSTVIFTWCRIHDVNWGRRSSMCVNTRW